MKSQAKDANSHQAAPPITKSAVIRGLQLRTKLAIDIPALSLQARQVLTEARDAIGRNDAQSVLQAVYADSKMRAELERFSKAVTERFGERTFLVIAARDANGEVFNQVATGMTAVQREDLRAAWNLLRDNTTSCCP